MNTIPTVTKNLLIINVLMFWAPLSPKATASTSPNIWDCIFPCRRFQCSTIDNIYVHARRIRAPVFNMFAVWMFGRILEQVWGPKRFLFYYLVCGIGAGIIQEVVQYIHYETVLSAYDSVNTGMAIIPMKEYLNMMTTVGASGAVYAILLAFGMLFPNQQMFIFPLPVPIKAKYFVIGYALIELYAGFANSAGDNVAHFAHLGGMVFGFILIMYWRKRTEEMATIITDLKETFRRGNIYIQLIYINVAVFILTTLTEVMFQLFNRSIAGVFEWLELPASVLRFILQPWSLLTYMFMHAGFMHILSICCGFTGSVHCS